jgi:hypothetical protein
MIEKNQAAVALGSLGGKARAARLSKDELTKIAMKGVRARKAKLSPDQRKEIAKKAAKARWAKQQKAADVLT